MNGKSWLLLLFFFVSTTFVLAQNQVASLDSLKKNVYFLASDSLKGRATGKEGQKLAAEFIASKFQQFGIEPLSGKGYFQTYSLMRDHRNYAVVKGSGNLLFWPWHFFFVSNFEHNDTLLTNLLFAGFGSLQEMKGLNSKGKAIAFVAEEPATAYQTLLKIKAEYGTKTFFVIFPKKNKTVEDAWSASYYMADYQLPEVYERNKLRKIAEPWATAVNQDSLNIFYCFPDVLRNVFSSTDAELYKLALNNQKTDENLLADFIQPQIECLINYSFKTDEIHVENVVSLIKGKDTTQTVVISAHYDHLGEEMGRIYYGADDNASGSAALLESARLIALDIQQSILPERNILFVAFSGEELGLLGSKAFVSSNWLNPLQVVLNINMDMVGRWDERHENNRDFVYLLTAGKYNKQLERIGKRAIDIPKGFKVSTKPGPHERMIFKYGSDHYSFLNKGIPISVFFTGLHPDYHTPNDTPNKINYKNLTNITTVVYRYMHQVSYNKDKYPLTR